MIYHYLKVAWRNLLKNKVAASLGIIGLSMGLLCFVLCNYCVRMLMDVDRAFPNHERIAEVSIKDEKGYFAGTPAHMVKVLKDQFPGKVECYTSVTYPWDLNASFELENGKKATFILNTIETDRNFRTIFPFRLIAGSWDQIIQQNNAVILSRTMARRIYGEESPLGKVFHPNELTEKVSYIKITPQELSAIDYVIMGVMEDLPVNASFSFLSPVDAVMLNDAYGLLANQDPKSGDTGCCTYALLRQGVTCRDVNQLVDIQKHGILLEKWMYVPDFLPSGKFYRDDYLPIASMYFGIGALILLVALLNFFTFMVGNFFNRLKEYNIRKGLGGSCRQLFGLLYTENLLYFIPVCILVFCLLELTYTSVDFGWGRRTIVFEIGLLYKQLLEYLVCGIVVCAFICLGISGWMSRRYIRGELRTSGKSSKPWGRNLMLGLQLVICSIFLTGCLALYLQSAKLSESLFSGLSKQEKENILEIQLQEPQLKGREKFLIERLSGLTGVTDVLQSDVGLLSSLHRGMSIRQQEYLEYRILNVGSNFPSFLNMPLLEGQIFKHPGQGIADPEVVKWLGEDPLNKYLENIDGPGFNICGLTVELPYIYTEGRAPVVWAMCEHSACCYLKVQPEFRAEVEAKATAILREWLPETVELPMKTLQQVIDKETEFYSKLQSILFFLTIVCIVITILGVYSAITMDTEKRRKEMAIRKINGASAWQITLLFVRLYITLLGVAVLISFPILWWGIQKWLMSFTVHFHYGWGFWLTGLSLMVSVIAITIVWKIREVMRINPVEVLRDE